MDAERVRALADEVPREPGVYMFLGRRPADATTGDPPTREPATDQDDGEATTSSSAPDTAKGPTLHGKGDAIGRAASATAADEGRVLYVGKAVDLADRVRSYADPRSARIGRMVAAADGIEVAVTDSETQALLLEANLVKRHQPPYNVRLKDDKSYPLVQLTDHPAPRIQITRDPDPGATVFGPFTDKGRLETVVKAAREAFGLRACSDPKFADRERPCLDYEMGICTAPCTDEIDADAYRADVEQVRRFLAGETGILAEPLRERMDAAAEEGAFERAANRRDELRAVEALHGEGDDAVQHAGEKRAVDVLGAVRAGDRAVVARLHASDGQLVDRERHVLDAPDDGDVGTVLAAFLAQYYADRDLPDAVLAADHPADQDVVDWLDREGVDLRVPGAGRDATLVDLALKNARRHRPEHDPCETLADALDIPSATRIEGFDVSHAHGRSVVGSNVCFRDGEPAKDDYRRKKLPEDNDDPAAMGRLIAWRAERAVAGRDDRPDPDLLLVDGGQAQLAAAREALADVGWDRPVVALAKAEELVHAPDATHDWADDAAHLHLLQRVRDEAHRFAVQYHQTLRDDVATVLDDVPGVGPTLRDRLLRRFGSVEGVRSASREELAAVDGVGDERAATISRRLG